VSVEDLDVVVAFLNCGHGDAAVVRFRDKGHVRTLVIDGGPPSYKTGLLDYLMRNNISTIDLMVATHIDRNHIGGLVPVVASEHITIENFWGPVCESTQAAVEGLRTDDERLYQRLYAQVARKVDADSLFCPTRTVPLPELFTDATLTVLNPHTPTVLAPAMDGAPKRRPTELAAEQNENSIVLHFEAHGMSALFTSDAEGHFWARVAQSEEYLRYLEAHILKMPNYGRISGFPPSLAAQIPELGAVVFSIDAKLDRQPSEEVVRLVAERGAQVFCTQHAPATASCTNDRCCATRGGQNVLFFAYHGCRSFPPGAEACVVGKMP